jgi:hypothetical protein
MGHISKGFSRYPDVVSIPQGPSARTKRGPSWRHIKGPPEDAIGTITVNTLPTAILIEHMGMVMQAWG